jgi:membrane protease YdiL (CAAX protease family)
MKKKTSKAFRQRRRPPMLRRHRKGGVIEEPDLGCLFSSPCDPTNCNVSRVKGQCVPKRVYDDIGYFTTGPIAQEYFKQVPKKILTAKGPKALQNYCEKQSYTTCPTDTCRLNKLGMCTYGEESTVLPLQTEESIFQRVFASVTGTPVAIGSIFGAKFISSMFKSIDVFVPLGRHLYSSGSTDAVMYRHLIGVNSMLDEKLGTDWTTTVASPVFEELAFRGTMIVADEVVKRLVGKLYDIFKWDPSTKKGMLQMLLSINLLTQAALFGMMHSNEAGGIPGDTMKYVLTTFLSGLVYGELTRKFSLKESMLSHMANNFMAFSTTATIFTGKIRPGFVPPPPRCLGGGC